ncbi:interferon-induced protein with tetratricopeptide repeats 5-like [Thunnus thynnus]|uniref:interferon-induced protein with tetratricopeptide repeats 5-like n=1 Tax=Thunnus thynnus TaxID=8237 RepID=UPI00352846F8
MSAAQSQSTLKAKLKALQCHFTWNIEPNSKLFRIKDKLEDIGTDEGNTWLGHIYNLQGYIHYQLSIQYQQSSTEDARRFFSKATEAFRNTVSDEGPWLLVNYGNLAWLHHHLGEQAECQTYLSKVDALLKEYPSPSQDELHPEIYAEKAWTLMKFDKDQYLLAADYFQRAIRMQPDMVEWNSSHVIALVKAYKYSNSLEEEILEKMKMATEQDPENLYLAGHYLEQRAMKEERIEDEAHELARKVLRNPVSSYSGLKELLWIYRKYVSVDEAIDLAEEALEKHPDKRFLKWCAALCYEWRILLDRDSRVKQSTIDRAIRLHREVISLYPQQSTSLLKKIALANIYAKSNYGLAEAEKIYQELLVSNLEPAEKQMLYHCYAKYLQFDRRDYNRSEEYYMKAAKMPRQSFFQENSIKVLMRIKETNRSRRPRELEEFLANLEVQKILNLEESVGTPLPKKSAHSHRSDSGKLAEKICGSHRNKYHFK